MNLKDNFFKLSKPLQIIILSISGILATFILGLIILAALYKGGWGKTIKKVQNGTEDIFKDVQIQNGGVIRHDPSSVDVKINDKSIVIYKSIVISLNPEDFDKFNKGDIEGSIKNIKNDLRDICNALRTELLHQFAFLRFNIIQQISHENAVKLANIIEMISEGKLMSLYYQDKEGAYNVVQHTNSCFQNKILPCKPNDSSYWNYIHFVPSASYVEPTYETQKQKTGTQPIYEHPLTIGNHFHNFIANIVGGQEASREE